MCPAQLPNHSMRLFFLLSTVLIGVSTVHALTSLIHKQQPECRSGEKSTVKFNSESPTRRDRVGGGNNVVCAALAVILIDAKCGSALEEKRDLRGDLVWEERVLLAVECILWRACAAETPQIKISRTRCVDNKPKRNRNCRSHQKSHICSFNTSTLVDCCRFVLFFLLKPHS
jgi:hypothetical protein